MAQKKKRKPIPQETQEKVLLSSRRRCTFCFGFKGDKEEKLQGQIAHVDRNASKADFENLVYLCMEHHDRYDLKASQSKGLTEGEALAYRSILYTYIEQSSGAWPDASPPTQHFSQERPTQISLELYDRRIKMYQFARDFIIDITRYAKVELQRALQFAADTEEVLFLYDESIEAYFSELYGQAIRLYTLVTLEQGGSVGDVSSLIKERYEAVLWFSKQPGELRRRLQSFLRTG